MNKNKLLGVTICLVLLGVGILLLAGWDMRNAQAARPDVWLIPESGFMPIDDAFYGSVQCSDDPDGFYVVAGWKAWFDNRNQVYYYDAANDNWTELAPYPEEMGITSVACYQGYLYAAGGNLEGSDTSNRFYQYNIAYNTWTQLDNLPRKQNGAALAAWDGYLYMIGGDDAPAVPVDPTTQVDRYNLQTGVWETNFGQPMPVSTLGDWLQAGKFVYVVGGYTSDYPTNSDATLRYDLSINSWEIGPSFASRRAFVALDITEGYLYAIGGDANGGGSNDATDLVERLDLSAWPGGEWEDISDPLPEPRGANSGFCSETMTGGEIWSLGGVELGYGVTPNIWYRPSEPCADFYFGNLDPESMDIDGYRGQTVIYSLSIHNDGTLEDNYDISISSNWDISYPSMIGPLAPGESAELLVSVTIPVDAIPGDSDTASITVTSQGNPNSEDDGVLTTTTVAAWTEASPIPFGVAYYGFAQCPNQLNSFYVISGAYDFGMATNNVWRYDAADDSWHQLAPIPIGQIGPAAVCYGNKIYSVAEQLQIYDIATDTWINTGSAPRLLYGSAMGTWDGKLYRVGGSPGGWNNPVPNVDVYDIISGTWQLDGGESIPVAVFAQAYTQVGQYLYIVGGNGIDSPAQNIDIVQRYDMANDDWEQIRFPSARGMGFALAYSGSMLYAIGGDLDGNDYYDVTDMVETLDLEGWPDSEWEMYADQFPYAMMGNGAGFCTEAITGGEIWSTGGGYLDEYGNGATLDVNVYHPTGEACLQHIVNLSDYPIYGEGKAGSTVTYTVDITNTGNIVDYYKMIITSDWLAYPLTDIPNPVEPGETVQVVIAVDVPSDALPGEVGVTTLRVESLRDPNIMDSAQIFTTVLSTLNVDVSPDELSVSGIYGEIITYTLTISNLGNITDTYALTCTGNTWDVFLPVTSLELGIGESADVVVVVTIPPDAWLGDSDSLTLTATSSVDPMVSDSATITTTTFWYRTLIPLGMRN